MALTKKEIEAKIAALEDRVSLLSQATDSLEWRFEYGLERWVGWAADLGDALAAIGRQIERIREKVPLPPLE